MIVNKRGLHARAAAKFVQCAERFDAEVTSPRIGRRVGGTSIMGLMMLAAGLGSTIRITAEGPEAEAALAALASWSPPLRRGRMSKKVRDGDGPLPLWWGRASPLSELCELRGEG